MLLLRARSQAIVSCPGLGTRLRRIISRPHARYGIRPPVDTHVRQQPCKIAGQQRFCAGLRDNAQICGTVPRNAGRLASMRLYVHRMRAHPGVACSPMRPFFSQRAIISQAMFLVFSLEAESVRNSADPWLFSSAVLSLRNNDIMSKPARPHYYLGKARTRNRNTTWSGLTS